MRATRLALASIATGSALALSLAVPASAATDPVGCDALNSGAAGLTCTHVGSNLYPGIAARVAVPPVHVGARVGLLTPTCDNVSGLLVQARLAVRIDAKALAADRVAAGKAHQDLVVAEQAERTAAGVLATRLADYNTAKTALANYDSTHGALPLPPVVAATRAALADAVTHAGLTYANAQTDKNTADTNLRTARANANAADARCATDQRTADADTALVVSLGVDLGKCQTPVVVPTTPPALPAPDVPIPDTTVVSPPPVVVASPPPSVTVINPQVGIIPQGAAPTGAVNPADRYAG